MEDKTRTSEQVSHLGIATSQPGHNVIDEESNVLALDALEGIGQKVEQLHTDLELLLYIGGREERHKAVHVPGVHCHVRDFVVRLQADA